MTTNVELFAGALDMMILKAASFPPLHGYAVARWTQAVTGQMLAKAVEKLPRATSEPA